jgi:imidazolonepropionase-like amidohydrolase
LAQWTGESEYRLDFLRNVHARIVDALDEGGVPLLVGTDAPNPFVVPGFAVHEELQRLVEAGLTPFDALSAATRRAAEFLGVLDVAGTVETGKQADLLLLDANPLEDISSTQKIAGVMVACQHGLHHLRPRACRTAVEVLTKRG